MLTRPNLFLSNVYAFAQKESSQDFLIQEGVMLERRLKSPEVSRYNDSVIFCPIFKNVSDKVVTGIKFSVSFKDAFGDEVLSEEGLKINEKILLLRTNHTNFSWNLENNPFINDEPYDKLAPLVAGNTIRSIIKVQAIIFDDGTSKQF